MGESLSLLGVTLALVAIVFQLGRIATALESRHSDKETNGG